MLGIPVIRSPLSTQSHTNDFDTASGPGTSSVKGPLSRSVDGNSALRPGPIADDHLIEGPNP